MYIGSNDEGAMYKSSVTSAMDNVDMTVELISTVALENGTQFSIREGGRTVGAGVVSEIIG